MLFALKNELTIICCIVKQLIGLILINNKQLKNTITSKIKCMFHLFIDGIRLMHKET